MEGDKIPEKVPLLFIESVKPNEDGRTRSFCLKKKPDGHLSPPDFLRWFDSSKLLLFLLTK